MLRESSGGVLEKATPVHWPPEIFEHLMKRVPEPLLIVDAAGQTLFCSHKATLLFGASEGELEALSIVNWLPDWFTLPATGLVLESSAVDANGRKFTVEINLAAMETPTGPVLISVLRDSSRHRAEASPFSVERESLREQIHELSLRERELQSELNQAASILEAHLPPKDLNVPNLEVAWKFSPCYTLGGDMIKLFPMSEKSLGFCILDVSGHGIPASLLAISLARSLSTDSTRGGILETAQGKPRKPRDILARLNKQYQILHEGEHFVTLLYGILDLPRKTIRYVAAGHPHPWRISKEGVNPLEGPINPPVGVMRSLDFEETVIQLSPGDTLFLFTDGVTETRGPSGELYGEERLTSFLEANQTLKPTELLEKLYQELERYRFCKMQTDDVTSLVFRILPL